ncbi:Dyp-type peroxidase [uncultured Methylobacterium sp.]|uniref:Dyp-type peroxidase n=1 Tax=uncultured Methylobacterium sp. TaxID=157278 RepID=UPI0035C9D93B
MPIDLTGPLAWTKADADGRRMLEALQGNILKGHGRHFTSNVFFRLDPNRREDARALLAHLAESHVTKALDQLEAAEHFKTTGKSGGPFVHLALAAAGYRAIGFDANLPADGDFLDGMRSQASRDALADGDLSQWEAPFREEIHGIVLAAEENRVKTDALAAILVGLIEDGGGTIVHIQPGTAIFNDDKEGIEHFGYVDGRSQPLLLAEDVDGEAATVWDPAFPLDNALVKDPGIDDEVSFGSYFIFRKLEQNVRGFKTREREIGRDLEAENAKRVASGAAKPGTLTGTDFRELAGAYVVGRFEDGTPITVADKAAGGKPPNSFDYAGDTGFRCPAHAHIRKTNPRGSGGGEPEAEERTHLLPRRGIPYEDVKREVAAKDVPEAETDDAFLRDVAPLLPEAGVGLLFMAYNGDMARQFAFTQRFWANNAGFPFDPPGPHGTDPVIGQAPAPAP